MARIYWDKTGTARALSGYFARRVSSPSNLTAWRGDFSELCALYKDHCYTLRHTRAEYEALDKKTKKQVKDIGGFIGACLKKPYRADENVTGRDFITIDADNAPADFISRWKDRINKAAIIHTTASHTTARPRYRLIIPLDSTLYLDGAQDADKARYKNIVVELLDLLGLLPYLAEDGEIVDPVDMQASADLSRLMFWPCCCLDEAPIIETVEGDFLDPARDFPLIRARLTPTEEQPLDPLQATEEESAPPIGSTEAQSLDAAFAALAGRTAEAQTPAPMKEQGTPPEVDAETAARKLGAGRIVDFKAMAAAEDTKDEAGRPIRTERRTDIKENQQLKDMDKSCAEMIVNQGLWQLIPDKAPELGSNEITREILYSIQKTKQEKRIAQCFKDCEGNEELFFNTIYGDLTGHNAAETFLRRIAPYVDTRAVFADLFDRMSVLTPLKAGLLDIAYTNLSATDKIIRPYMPIVAGLLEIAKISTEESEATEELKLERQDESTDAEKTTDGKDGRE